MFSDLYHLKILLCCAMPSPKPKSIPKVNLCPFSHRNLLPKISRKLKYSLSLLNYDASGTLKCNLV